MPDTMKMKLPNANAQPEYILPANLVKCPFDLKQEYFWHDLNQWFAQMDKDPALLTQENGEKAGIPPRLHQQMVNAIVTRRRAFEIIYGRKLGFDTKGFLKDHRQWQSWRASCEGRKIEALKHLRWRSQISSPFITETIHEAARRNDSEFFKNDLPKALKAERGYAGVFVGLPSAQDEILMGLWCGTQLRPALADIRLPPLCIFTDQALDDFLNLFFGRANQFSGTRKFRQRLGFKQVTTVRIRSVTKKSGRFLFSPKVDKI